MSQSRTLEPAGVFVPGSLSYLPKRRYSELYSTSSSQVPDGCYDHPVLILSTDPRKKEAVILIVSFHRSKRGPEVLPTKTDSSPHSVARASMNTLRSRVSVPSTFPSIPVLLTRTMASYSSSTKISNFPKRPTSRPKRPTRSPGPSSRPITATTKTVNGTD